MSFNGSTLSVTGSGIISGDLTVNGNLTSNGTINIGNSTLVFSGTAAQNVSISETLFNLTLNNSNGLTLGQNLTVSNNLNLTAGTLNIDTRSLTLNGSISRTSGNINASNATANVTFSSIPQDYTHLQLRMIIKGHTANTNNTQIQFNSDTATNYSWHYVRGTGSAANSSAGAGGGGAPSCNVVTLPTIGCAVGGGCGTRRDDVSVSSTDHQDT
jgi:hypothetical protein